jgi:hypothetical protein
MLPLRRRTADLIASSAGVLLAVLLLILPVGGFLYTLGTPTEAELPAAGAHRME